ncbi:hypothetical protein D5S17_04305 [Pseudonocardiaceae bacterium YIM PH 21723]|nr:hypothetical protein D5S17_04305 [Pseudonocardiaceae bacterium YIM PH 21723]
MAATGQPLPLDIDAADARQVITVVAEQPADTRGRLQRWERVPGGWQPVGEPVPADLGRNGMSPHTREGLAATPMGGFAVNRSFGSLADPGTTLPYVRTEPADWWISEPGPLYNTYQRCVANCRFALGEPNEHLSYAQPFYRYAAVIEYNTDPVAQGAGSAFFLHVTAHEPTQGCVAVPEPDMVALLRWLNPAAAPRILIGTRSTSR